MKALVRLPRRPQLLSNNNNNRVIVSLSTLPSLASQIKQYQYLFLSSYLVSLIHSEILPSINNIFLSLCNEVNGAAITNQNCELGEREG
mmetsp:Transcript_1054/g.1651  ORF Transcript_1054/g.1651 Transcript_1054/m.1651 type:complete len:89 (+) Transcript_1054:1617-1883(+)